VVLRVSLMACNEDLALLATADILGRDYSDTAEVLENIVLREAPDVTEAHTVQRVDTAP
jgi:hypothetical protein